MAFETKKLDESNFEEITTNKDDILKILENFKANKKIDYFILNTDFDLTKYINENNLKLCNLILKNEKNSKSYFCSYSYCLINNLLYKYNSLVSPKSVNSFVLINNDNIIKYVQKCSDRIFCANADKEIIIIKQFEKFSKNKQYDFINNQTILLYDSTELYLVFARKKIIGSPPNKNFILNLNICERMKAFVEILRQLYILEKHNLIYSDLDFRNIIMDDKNNINLIDLGSLLDKTKYINIYSKEREKSFGIYESFFILFYNFFRSKNKSLNNIYDINSTYIFLDINNYDIAVRKIFLKILDSKKQITNNMHEILYNIFKKIQLNNGIYEICDNKFANSNKMKLLLKNIKN